MKSTGNVQSSFFAGMFVIMQLWPPGLCLITPNQEDSRVYPAGGGEGEDDGGQTENVQLVQQHPLKTEKCTICFKYLRWKGHNYYT